MIESISLKKDLSDVELAEFRALRELRANSGKTSQVKPRVAAMAQIEEAFNRKGTKINTVDFARLSNMDSASYYSDVLLPELKRMDAQLAGIDAGSSYLLLPATPQKGADTYRAAAIRSYFQGEEISPKK